MNILHSLVVVGDLTIFKVPYQRMARETLLIHGIRAGCSSHIAIEGGDGWDEYAIRVHDSGGQNGTRAYRERIPPDKLKMLHRDLIKLDKMWGKDG